MMKKIVILTSLITAVITLSACSTYCNSPCAKSEEATAAPCPAAQHHDLKGECAGR